MKTIKDKDTTIAIYIPKDTEVNGLKFISPEDYPLQVGLIQHKEEKKVPPHIHRNFNYDVKTTQEFVYVIEGKNIEVEVFNNEWKELDKLILSTGDAIFFVGGGHSFKIPKGCRLFEVKQGPYPGEKNAKIFKD